MIKTGQWAKGYTVGPGSDAVRAVSERVKALTLPPGVRVEVVTSDKLDDPTPRDDFIGVVVHDAPPGTKPTDDWMTALAREVRAAVGPSL